MSMDLLAVKSLDLAHIRYALIRQEDTIIVELIERCQFPLNESIYVDGAVPIQGYKGSFLDFVMLKSEEAHALVGRYQSLDEYAFSKDLPAPIIETLAYPPLIRVDRVNVNDKIKQFYLHDILPALLPSKEEKKAYYGSAAESDVKCLQALSRRIHFGKFVAEVKFLSDVPGYTKMIRERDVAGLEASITNAAVEKQVLARLEKKAIYHGRDPLELESTSAAVKQAKIDAKTVVAMYENFVIPLTKEVEIEYLLTRLDD